MGKKKQKVVTSPRLLYDVNAEWLIIPRDKGLVCVKRLCAILGIDLPLANYYWLEASLTQWDDDSGTLVTVCCDATASWRRVYVNNEKMYLSLAYRLLRQLGVPQGKDTKIYARLTYEE